MKDTVTVGTTTGSVDLGDNFPELREAVRLRFEAVTGGGAPLFRTDASGLYDIFLENIPPDWQGHYNCRACRQFVERFGGLVTLSPEGATVSALWSAKDAPKGFAPAVKALEKAVRSAPITGVFLPVEHILGTPQSPPDRSGHVWTHLWVSPHGESLYRGSLLSASQAEAEKAQDRETLERSVGEFKADVVAKALYYLQGGQLSHPEKCQGIARWFLDLHNILAGVRNRVRRRNLLWLAAATAPTGFCHVRGTVLGSLLEDIGGGIPFPEIKRRFDGKMDPGLYQRPQAPPKTGNIERAERLVADLQSAGALDRRFARLSEVQAIWKPRETSPPSGGVFGHLKKRAATGIVPMPARTLTWEKFRRTVLPDAERIEYCVGVGPSSYAALVTAVNPDAPPILQWDLPEARNPVSWYVYRLLSAPEQWNLNSGYVAVTAVTLQPSMWGGEGKFAHQGESVIFLLEGAVDLRNNCLGLFPQVLKGEYHEIRATIEAYSGSRKLSGADEASACGIRLERIETARWNHRFRVTANGTETVYTIDRWD